MRDFSTHSAAVDLVLRSAGDRSAFGRTLELYRADDFDTPVLVWNLDTAIAVAVPTHAQYAEIIKGVVDSFGVSAVFVSSLIGHSLDALALGIPTVVVTHDYFPFCVGISLRFGDVCTRCDTPRLSQCLAANEMHPFRGMTDAHGWQQLRARYLECLARPLVLSVCPNPTVREHLVQLDARFAAFDWRVIPHGMDRKPLALSSWSSGPAPRAGSPLERPLRVLVLGRLNAHKGTALLRRLVEELAGDVSFTLLGCGRFGLEFQNLPAVERIEPDYVGSELESLVREIAPDCGLLLSVWPETFSYTLSELHAFGIPPVATRLGAFASRIEDGINGFLCDPEVGEIAANLRRLHAHPELLAEMAQALLLSSTRSVVDMVADYDDLLAAMMANVGGMASAPDVRQSCLLAGVEGAARKRAEVREMVVGHAALVESLQQDVIGRELQLDEARQIIARLEAEIAAGAAELRVRDNAIAQLEQSRVELQEVYHSRSWRVTAGLRATTVGCRRLASLGRAGLRFLVREARDPVRMARRVVAILRQPRLGGVRQIMARHSGVAPVPEQPPESGASAVTVSSEYRELNENLRVDSRIRAIAFYLPQFHPIPENDAWWGRGFTEWTNVSRAVPQFEGHYQPHLPGELGFYDLRLPDVQKRQMALARNYGLSGFCYYYYWFSGRRLLEKPLEQHLADPGMDFPFCVCWANENWTRRWDGKDDEVLMAQHYRPEDAEQFIRDLLPVLSDPRYIRVDGRVVLLVYRVDQIPDCERVAALWRRLCSENGIGDPLLVAVQSFAIEDPGVFGFDAAVEFPPHRTHPTPPQGGIQVIKPGYAGTVFDYSSVIPERVSWPDYKLFRGVMPSWDNEARRPGRGSTFVNAVPSTYGSWLDRVCAATDDHYAEVDEKLVFINAWNEWAEGAHLEPDRRFGYGFLQATADVLSAYPRKQLDLIALTQRERPRICTDAVILNLFYDDLWGEISGYLENLSDFDLYVSVRPTIKPGILAEILTRFPSAELVVFPNRGRDIGPFMGMMQRIEGRDYRYVCKIHSKKSLHRADGDSWRRDLFEKLLGTRRRVEHILSLFQSHPDVGLVGPEGHLVLGTTFWGANEARVKSMAAQMGMAAVPDAFSFFAGSMFWFRPAALQPLLALGLRPDDFEAESGQVDGTLAHAIERLFPLAVEKAGYRMVEASADQVVDGSGAREYAFCEAR
jgi:lipopolysaccharide biosynthesis protein/glycosyltransferase involved in cell wall biosynthesis